MRINITPQNKNIEKADFFNYYKDSLAVLDAKRDVLEKLKIKANILEKKNSETHLKFYT